MCHPFFNVCSFGVSRQDTHLCLQLLQGLSVQSALHLLKLQHLHLSGKLQNRKTRTSWICCRQVPVCYCRTNQYCVCFFADGRVDCAVTPEVFLQLPVYCSISIQDCACPPERVGSHQMSNICGYCCSEVKPTVCLSVHTCMERLTAHPTDKPFSVECGRE